ncbi:MAG: group II intron reverse transcriptase/maturase [Oligoflexales bacterium]|nr:group II intron reverse transcriptase/maturase [Oligoflexales bacterium]
MEMEQRGRVNTGGFVINLKKGGVVNTTKPFDIPRQLFRDAWRLVKANKGSAGVDGQSIEDFEMHINGNLYKIWNRMSSGTYFPPPVKGVEIPKKSGGARLLGVPSISDRLAQTVVKLYFEPIVEKIFLEDSYGYRPDKSAHDAIEVTRKRCWQYGYLLEFDIVKLFDEIQHSLLMKAIKQHTDCKWVILYIERWLKAPFEMPDGTIVERKMGTPQGGVISPVLSNLFLHYAFDVWMKKTFPNLPWARYADDAIVHCNSYNEAISLKKALEQRMEECGLKLHPSKTRIVYCRINKGQRIPSEVGKDFTFLGFCFRARGATNKTTGKVFTGFLPAVSKESLKRMREVIRDEIKLESYLYISLEDLAKRINPIVRGWIQYYGACYRTALYPMAYYLNERLVRWLGRKHNGRRHKRTLNYKTLGKVCRSNPKLFEHWQLVPVR